MATKISGATVTKLIFHYLKITYPYLRWIYKLNYGGNHYKHMFSTLHLVKDVDRSILTVEREWNAVYLHRLLFHLLYLLHPSLRIRTEQRLWCWNAIIRENKQTNKGTSECLLTNNSTNRTVEFSYIQVNRFPVWKTSSVLWKHWPRWGWGSNSRIPFHKFLCLLSNWPPRAALSKRPPCYGEQQAPKMWQVWWRSWIVTLISCYSDSMWLLCQVWQEQEELGK